MKEIIRKRDAQILNENGFYYFMDGTVDPAPYDQFQYVTIQLKKLIQPQSGFFKMLVEAFQGNNTEAQLFGQELNALLAQFKEINADIKDAGGLVAIPDAEYFERKFNAIFSRKDKVAIKDEFRGVVRQCITNNYKEAVSHGITIPKTYEFTQKRVAAETDKNRGGK